MAKTFNRGGFLGIDAGGTRTTVLWADDRGQTLEQFAAGPGNFRLNSVAALKKLLRQIAARIPQPRAVGLGMAGLRTAADRDLVQRLVQNAWPRSLAAVTHDLEIALAALDARDWLQPQSKPPQTAAANVLVLSGTGSCCFGKNCQGRSLKVGGWGHLLGDRGSGYEISLAALRGVLANFDAAGRWPILGRKILRFLQLNDAEQLVPWAQSASKSDVAALAPLIFEAARDRNLLARAVLQRAAGALVSDALACARGLARASQPVQFVLAGGVLRGQTSFAKEVAKRLIHAWPEARAVPAPLDAAWGAAALARTLWAGRSFAQMRGKSATPPDMPNARGDLTARARVAFVASEPSDGQTDAPARLANSPTEQRNPHSAQLDTMPLLQAIQLMLDDESTVPRALAEEAKRIATAVRWISARLRDGGSLFYVGAGTSGRLGALDASECPPTFRAPPDQVQAIIAGGAPALWRAVEGAEDDLEAGRRAIAFRGVGPRDVAVGIAASGGTPFVWGALEQAKARGAKTVLITFNPRWRELTQSRPDLAIAPFVGPEILTGSTRLKCGSATKLLLNILSTLTMVRLGKVWSNLMADLHPANAKLRDRAVRIVAMAAGCDRSAARAALEKSAWRVKSACQKLAGRRRLHR